MDLSTLSDADLSAAIQAMTPQAPQGPGADLSKLSDADLQKAIDAATPKAEPSSSLAGSAKS